MDGGTEWKLTADLRERQGSHAVRPGAFFLLGGRLAKDTVGGGPARARYSGLGSSLRCSMTVKKLRGEGEVEDTARRRVNDGILMPSRPSYRAWAAAPFVGHGKGPKLPLDLEANCRCLATAEDAPGPARIDDQTGADWNASALERFRDRACRVHLRVLSSFGPSGSTRPSPAEADIPPLQQHRGQYVC